MRAKLGQNFLVSAVMANKIAEAANLSKKDTVLEIGPGRGILTNELIKRAGKVVAVEKDKKLFNFLKEKFSQAKNLDLICADIRDVLRCPRNYKLRIKNYVVVANIPYYITSFLFRLLLEESKNKPSRIVLTVQKEVAERITACPPKMNLLALSVLVYGKAKIAFMVKKGNFRPRPKVDSAVLIVSSISDKFFQSNKIDEKKFFKFLKLSFSQPRKTLANNLVKRYFKPKIQDNLEKCGLSFNVRAQELSLKDWVCLYKNF